MFWYVLMMKASFTDATLHKPVQWPQRKRRGAHGSKRYLKGSCMNQYHQTNKEEETSAMVASSCYTLSRKLTDGKWWWRGSPWIIERKTEQRMSRRYRSVQDTAESVKELGTDGEERPAPGKCGSQRPAPAGGGHSRLRACEPCSTGVSKRGKWATT